MNKICLIKAGKFLLGLNTSNIVSILSVDELKDSEINWNDFTFFSLESFLVQKDLEISCSKIIVLKNKKKNLAILIDKILEEIKLPDKFAPYPPLYPELAIKCCPKIFVHEEKIVLLLDPKQLNIIHKKLKTEYGLITLKDLLNVEEKVEQENIAQPDSTDEIARDKSIVEIDDKTITSIVSWTFDKYNQFYNNEKIIKLYSNEKIIISADELPPTLIAQQGLSSESLQLIIDQAIGQCEKARYNTMKNMIIDQLNGIEF